MHGACACHPATPSRLVPHLSRPCHTLRCPLSTTLAVPRGPKRRVGRGGGGGWVGGAGRVDAVYGWAWAQGKGPAWTRRDLRHTQQASLRHPSLPARSAWVWRDRQQLAAVSGGEAGPRSPDNLPRAAPHTRRGLGRLGNVGLTSRCGQMTVTRADSGGAAGGGMDGVDGVGWVVVVLSGHGAAWWVPCVAKACPESPQQGDTHTPRPRETTLRHRDTPRPIEIGRASCRERV